MNSKAKGSSYERKIAKEISLWLSYGEADDWVWRTASSGGKASQTKASKYYHGDLMPVHEHANWLFNYISIECKNVSRVQLNLFKLFTGKRFQLHDFWKQARFDAQKSHRKPVLIFHLPNTKFDLVMFKYPDFRLLSVCSFDYVPFIELPGDLIILRLDQVLKKLNPETLKFYLGRHDEV